MWSALFGSDEDTSRQPETDVNEHEKVYGAGDEPDAMTMLLGRLTHLLERLGEAEYSKKKWEEQARKLDSVNQQLKFQLEYSSDKELRDRIDDLTAMNEALKEVKSTLEKDLETKDEVLKDQNESVQRLEALVQSSTEKEMEVLDILEASKLAHAQEVEVLTRTMERQTLEVERLSQECEGLLERLRTESTQFQQSEEALRAEITSLEAQIHAERSQVEYLLEDVKQKEEELIGQKDIEAELRTELSQLHQNTTENQHASNQKLHEAELQLHSLREQLLQQEALESQSKWKEEAIQSLTKQVQTVQKELSDAMTLNLEVNNEKLWLEEQAQSAYAAYQQDLIVSKERAEYFETQAKLLEVAKHSKEELEHELENQKKLLEQKETELSHLAQSLSEYESSIQHSTAGVESMRQEMEELHGRIAHLTHDIQTKELEWSQKYDESIKETEESQFQLAQSQKEAKAQREMNSTLEAELDQLGKELEYTTKELASAKENESFQNEFNEERKQLLAELDMARAELEHEKNAVIVMKENMAAMVEENSVVSEQLYTLEAEKEEIESELNEKIASLELNLQESNNALHESQQSTAAVTEELRTFESYYDNYKIEIETLKSQMDQLQSENNRLKENESILESTSSSKLALEQELDALKERYDQVVAKYDQELHESQTALECTRLEIISLKNQVENAQDFAKDCEESVLEWQTKYDELAIELESVQDKASQSTVALEAVKEKSFQEQQALEASYVDQLNSEKQQVVALEHELESSRTMINKLTNEMIELDSNYSKSNQEKEVSEEKLHQLEVEITRLNESMAYHQQNSVNEINEFHLQIKNLIEERDGLKITIKKLNENDIEIKTNLNKELNNSNELKNEIKNLLNEKESFELKYKNEMEINMKELKLKYENNIIELNNIIQTKNKMVENLHLSSEMATQQYEEHIRELQEEIHKHSNRFEGETEELLEEIANLNSQLSEYQVQNNVLTARAHRLARDLSQYVKLPPDDMALILNPNTPNLWELLSNGMEQLKTDLEIASSYAASLDQMDNSMDNLQDGNFHSEEIYQQDRWIQ